MSVIKVELPSDRDYEGTIRVEDDSGHVIVGPYPALGRAESGKAEEHKNSDRNPLMLYGDTPLGQYTVAGFRFPKDAKQANRLGPYSRIELTPVNGVPWTKL